MGGDSLQNVGQISGATGVNPTSTERVRAELHSLEAALHRAQAEPIPSDDPSLAGGSRLRRAAKRRQFRLTRPISRRSDRISAELAGLAAQLAEQVAESQVQIEILRRSLDTRQVLPTPAPFEPHDAYYWAFEGEMRGSPEVIMDRLGQYEELATRFLTSLGRSPAPLWLDIGCGQGEFLSLLRQWGWRVRGLDNSQRAVEACRARGVDAVEGDALAYLAARQGEAPSVISAIQVIEHLPKDQWLAFLEATHRALRPGGWLLVETINPMIMQALTDSFFADISHTWPAHPHTLRLMATHVGFSEVRIMYLNDALDFAIWAAA